MMESLCDSVSRICEFFIFGLFLLVHSSSAQEGFVSLACCADSNFIDTKTNISWISDYSWFPNRTSCINITNPTNSNNEEKSRIFEIASGKICYNLTTTKDEEYLVRATFLNSNSQIVGASSFNVYVGGNALSLVNSSEEVEIEGAFLASRNYINFCLEKGQGDPYISYLELRPLQDLEYLQGLSPSVLKLVSRINLGNTSVDIRYPDDRSDRIWKSLLNTDPEIDSISAANISIINYNASVRAPLAVLQTAVTHSNRLVFLHNNLDVDAYEYRVFLYFLELNGNVQPGQRVFDIYVNGEKRASNFDILVNGSNYASAVFNSQANGSLNLTLAKISDGKDLGPICNGYEILQLRPSVPTPGQSDDVEVILKVRDELLVSNQRNELLRNWTGDPCLPFHWEGLACETTNGVSAITKLDLSARNFRGPFPLSITKLTRVETLNLSYNGFTGNIPFFPASLNLKLVDLSHNDFTGVLPESLAVLQHLETLNFGCNQLSENLPPNFNSSKISTDYGKCRRLGSSPPINGIVIGTVAFGSLVFTIVVGVVYVCVCRQKLSLQRNFHGKEQLIPKRIIVHLPSPDVGITMSQIKSFSLADIEEATENYRTLIGEGGFGCVFQGRLSDGREVAVKVRSATSTQGTREFDNELSFLSKIQHENLVPLLGSCGENDQQILVYPFMSNGSLQDRLYGELSKRKPLDWPTRLSIALGAARGLTYLHTFSGRCVIHRDVKSSNILLDHSMCAKVADFGFSKFAPQEGDSCASVEVRGTAGYLDPEYYTTHHLSAKSDVFSFGVVLLEIVSGREPLNIRRPRNEWSLVEWAKPYVRDGKIDEIVDPSIKGGYHGEAMWRVVEVAAACVESFSAYRPCMADVVRELEDALIIENNASEYMRSIDSLGGSNRYSIVVDKKIVIPSTPSPTPTPTPTQPSPIAHELAPPEPR